jgi:hypothetical protein
VLENRTTPETGQRNGKIKIKLTKNKIKTACKVT